MDRKYIISSEAGDGINGKSYSILDDAKAAVTNICDPGYGRGEWQEVAGAPDSERNAHEYLVDGDSVARIEYAAVTQRERITLQRSGNRVNLLNDSGTVVAWLNDGEDTITYDPMASTSEMLGEVNYRQVIESQGIDAFAIRLIDGMPVRDGDRGK